MPRPGEAKRRFGAADVSAANVKRTQASGGSQVGTGTSEIRRMPIGRELYAETT
jgi:hypothetical protein